VSELGLDEDATTLREIERQIGVALKAGLAAQPDQGEVQAVAQHDQHDAGQQRPDAGQDLEHETSSRFRPMPRAQRSWPRAVGGWQSQAGALRGPRWARLAHPARFRKPAPRAGTRSPVRP